MTPKNLIDLVRKEADALRKHATKEEISNLNLSDLQPKSASNCIYGLMTGSCWSERAHTLIDICTQKKIRVATDVIDHGNTCSITEDDLTPELMAPGDNRNWSPIEAFIAVPENRTNGNNQILIGYLKGLTNTLDLIPWNVKEPAL